jgi:hypothetical protein
MNKSTSNKFLSILAALAVSVPVLAQNQTTEYDYVIIGSGPGGGSLA